MHCSEGGPGFPGEHLPSIVTNRHKERSMIKVLLFVIIAVFICCFFSPSPAFG